MLDFLSVGSARKRSAPLSARTVVAYGAAGVRIEVTSGRGAGSWLFRWRDIRHYSVEEGHFWNSDAIVLALRGEPPVIAIPTEARGAREFLQALERHRPPTAGAGRPEPGGPGRLASPG